MGKGIFALVIGLAALNVCTSSAAPGYTKTEAGADGQKLWMSGCSDFKNGLSEGDFLKWLKLEDRAKDYPQLKRTATVSLYMDGWDSARFAKGVINCADVAPKRASDYASGIDIRKAD